MLQSKGRWALPKRMASMHAPWVWEAKWEPFLRERIQSHHEPTKRKHANGDILVTVELCAGCARLSFSLNSRGFSALAVDHSKNRHSQLHPCMMFDLADDSSLDQLLSILEGAGCIIYTHAAPPCGTCSRARERKIPRRLMKTSWGSWTSSPSIH